MLKTIRRSWAKAFTLAAIFVGMGMALAPLDAFAGRRSHHGGSRGGHHSSGYGHSRSYGSTRDYGHRDYGRGDHGNYAPAPRYYSAPRHYSAPPPAYRGYGGCR